MKITLFTSNNLRHQYFINLLSSTCEKLYVVQECKNLSKQTSYKNISNSEVIKNYFINVNQAQNKIFGSKDINLSPQNIIKFQISHGELNNLPFSKLENFLKSDLYIVFGSSYIKNNLIKFLIKNKAINIHAGVSPFYRGTDCNFWALYDGNPHLVGSTVHLLSEGLDNGPIIYHAMSNIKTTPYEYTMSTVKAAFHSIFEKIKDKTIFKFNSIPQDNNKEIRYSKKNEFNEKIVKKYLEKKIDLNNVNFDNSLLIKPFFLEK